MENDYLQKIKDLSLSYQKDLDDAIERYETYNNKHEEIKGAFEEVLTIFQELDRFKSTTLTITEREPRQYKLSSKPVNVRKFLETGINVLFELNEKNYATISSQKHIDTREKPEYHVLSVLKPSQLTKDKILEGLYSALSFPQMSSVLFEFREKDIYGE